MTTGNAPVPTLHARDEEHRISPKAIGWFLAGRLSIENQRVLLDGQQRPEQGLNRDIPVQQPESR